MHIRFDATPVSAYDELPDGRLRVKASFSRVGELEYLNADGTKRIEVVPPETLFDTASLDTAGLAAVTLNHPPEFVTPKNWKKYSVGASGNKIEARADRGLVEVVFVVGDEEAIAAIKKGDARQVSAGYTAEVQQRADGKLYQVNRVYNHFAIVPRGRAGPDVALRYDAADVAYLSDQQGDAALMKWKGFDIADSGLYDAIKDIEDSMKAMKADMSKKRDAAEVDTLQARCDTLEARIKELETDLSNRMDAAQVETEVKNRLDVWDKVRPFLGEDAKFDATDTPLAMKMKAIAASNPSINLEGKSAEYVDAAFDTLISLGVHKKADSKTGDSYADTLRRVAETGEGDRSGSSARVDADAELDKQYNDALKAYYDAMQTATLEAK